GQTVESPVPAADDAPVGPVHATSLRAAPRFCTWCGTDLGTGDRYCAMCGHPTALAERRQAVTTP
ncbi:MAG TPA: zinc-ribbon domain-containing protein, partial [Longimicrobiales bacterium]|nr:zinc-ribbon domain-containing protein [Longimicrobiales bacterium]